MLKASLFKLSFEQIKVDPYLYTKNELICTIYVDDVIFWSPDESELGKCISELKSLNFDLTYEVEVDSFLGIQKETAEDKNISTTQHVLTDTIIKSTGLDDASKQ